MHLIINFSSNWIYSTSRHCTIDMVIGRRNKFTSQHRYIYHFLHIHFSFKVVQFCWSSTLQRADPQTKVHATHTLTLAGRRTNIHLTCIFYVRARLYFIRKKVEICQTRIVCARYCIRPLMYTVKFSFLVHKIAFCGKN